VVSAWLLAELNPAAPTLACKANMHNNPHRTTRKGFMVNFR
jgi:hypothetical protein